MENSFLESETVSIRYIVNDVAESITFYTQFLGFEVIVNPPKGFAMLSRGNMRLLLNEPGAGGGGQSMTDGTNPSPGGWNRIQLQTDNIVSAIDFLKRKNARFRNELIAAGNGGKQILLLDPSGNLIELIEPNR
jgi:catechol 2,3-dioxygenase-like lactoylglutathione lyase family enzyme